MAYPAIGGLSPPSRSCSLPELFSWPRGDADAVRIPVIAISERSVRRVVHGVGVERIGERDRSAVEHRRRLLVLLTEVLPAVVVVEADGVTRTRATESAHGVHVSPNTVNGLIE